MSPLTHPPQKRGIVGKRGGCFDPIVCGTRQPGRASRPLPDVAPQLVAVCRSDVTEAPSVAAAPDHYQDES